MSYAIPVFFVLLTWWFSTGAIIYLNNLPARTFSRSISIATALLPFCFIGVHELRNSLTAGAAYISFTCGLVVWGWTQLTFYTGTISGPRREPCEPDCKGWLHFRHAIETSLYHEIAALAAGAAIFAAASGGGNWTGPWTYAILWIMHSSAKVNAVLGVRNLNEEFFPPHLKYLRSFLRKRAINILFPFSITGGTIAALLMFQNAASTTSPFGFINAVLLGSMMALAVLEHWLLILPIPAATLWNWGLRSRKRGTDDTPPAPATRLAISRANRVLPFGAFQRFR